ncbi:MAG: hypothetical protein Q9O62_14250 [Ardenticatenia bacterium]|nr:hypothetical protein [Ardenticatenia bacterium]
MGATGAGRNGRLDAATLRLLVEGVLATEETELSCDECFEELDRFAELVLAGREIPEAMRLVQAHLERCGDCREEFEALLAALRHLSSSE